MTKLWDNPRPIGYWPNTPSQWREPTVDDCTWYATEFAFEAASETHRSVHPVKELREYSSDTEGGTPVSVAIRETSRLWPNRERVHAVHGAWRRPHLVDCLKKGAVLVLGGDYEKLPEHYRRWTYNDTFDHAMACKTWRINGLKEETFLYDPLGGGRTYEPYDGEWIRLDKLLNSYTWRNGDKYWAAIVQNEGDEPMKRVYLHPEQATNREVRARAGTVVRVAPRNNSDRTRNIWKEVKWFDHIGNAAGGWLLIGWDLAKSSKNIGYIHLDDVFEARSVELPEQDGDAYKLAIASLNNQLDDYEEVVSKMRDELATLPE